LASGVWYLRAPSDRSGLGFLEQAGTHRTDHAGSIASLMLTAEALIAEIPEKKEAPIPGGGHGGGMGDMH
jgi:hypothetical protein